ncbi:hypothetical protein ATANTOWER_017858 [Ataeniobius toweri]|uniref:Uncharacterized protein n=1 Tax=Ataeniobius toweri TaxID=208326 RepID=A0ABU7BS90_9TELE|nr:hypothetical protein [Ataeniobius toweri]
MYRWSCLGLNSKWELVHYGSAARIFVNRSLAMEKIKCFGFDMDYTLADSAPAFGLHTSKNKPSPTLKSGSHLFVGFTSGGSPDIGIYLQFL